MRDVVRGEEEEEEDEEEPVCETVSTRSGCCCFKAHKCCERGLEFRLMVGGWVVRGGWIGVM
jgi:hypothetical protein